MSAVVSWWQAPEIGVHRPLALGREQDHRARRRRAIAQPRHAVMDADALRSSAKTSPRRRRPHLADKRGAAAERGDARRGIGRAAARNLAFLGRHAVVEIGRPLRIDEVHDALGHALALEEVRIDRRDDVDDGVADGENVKPGLGHGNPWYGVGPVAGDKGLAPAHATRGHEP